MTAINTPDVHIPANAAAGAWFFLNSRHPDEAYRHLTWARFDAAGLVVAVEGAQYGDGRVERLVALDGGRIELARPADARQLAAALLDAADALEALR